MSDSTNLQNESHTRVSPTVVIEDPKQTERETFQKLCIEAKAIETKVYDDKKFNEKEEEKKLQYNHSINTIAAAEFYILQTVMERNLALLEERVLLQEATAHHSTQPATSETAESSSSSSASAASQANNEAIRAAEQAKLVQLMQDKARLAEQLKAAEDLHNQQWGEALETAAAVLSANLEKATPELVSNVANAMAIDSNDPEKLAKLQEDINQLNSNIVEAFQSRPSIPDIIEKQKDAYDAIYNHEREEQKSPEQAAAKVAVVAEQRHDLMAQIRAAGAARAQFAGQKDAFKGAMAYANKAPLDEYNAALHEETRPSVQAIIDARYEQKENAKEISNAMQAINETFPKKNPALEAKESSPEEAAKRLAKFVERAESAAEADLKEENQASTRLTASMSLKPK
jgi:hypothetical protein